MTATFEVQLLRGRDAVVRGMTPERVSQWQALAEAAATVAVYQSPGFVLPWYEVYEPDYEPLILLGVAGDGTLVGILPLAIRRQAPETLCFAGAEHCEYASWLASPAVQLEFPAVCVRRLSELGLFAGTWDWRWLAPGTSLAWLDRPELASRGITGHVSQVANPVLALQDPDRPRFFDPHGKNSKRKMNLLKRAGVVTLARLDAGSLTAALFDRFKTFYDIRQLARHGVAPFREDPLKGPFHRRLLEAPDLVLCFALTVVTDPVAFHWSLVDRRRAMYCMGPFDLRWLAASPGKLMADLVAEALRERGVECLDHTPGGDEYKEEAASRHEVVHRLELFPSRRHAWVHGAQTAARDAIKRGARAVGVSPARLRTLQDLVTDAARSPVPTVRVALRAWRRWPWSRRVVITYRLTREAWERAAPGSKPDPLFRKDMLEDFLLYPGSRRGLSRQELMQSAIEGLRRGCHCYTVVEDGVLVHSAWLHVGAQEIELSEVGYRYRIPPNGCVLFDERPDGAAVTELRKRSFRHRLHEAFSMGADYVTGGMVDNLVDLGVELEPLDQVTQITRLGRRRAQRQPIPPRHRRVSA